MIDKVELGKLCVFENGDRGKNYPSQKSFVSEGIPFVNAGNLKNQKINKSKFKYISEEHFNKISSGKILLNDILFCLRGSLGKFALNKNTEVGAIASSLVIIRAKENLDQTYLAYFLLSPTCKALIKKNDNGSSQPNLSASSVKNFKIPLPPLAEQKKIAAILVEADRLRQLNQQVLDQYDALTQSLFLDMFGDVIKNPKNWQKHPLGELTHIRRGASPRPIKNFIGGNVPWIKIGDGTKNGSELYITKTKVAITEAGAKKSVILEPGSLIFANCGVSLGFARIIKIRGCIHDGWLSIEKIDEKILNKIFLLKLINSVTDYFRKTAPDGTQPNLNSKIMKKFEIPLPPIKLQNKFETLYLDVESQKSQAQITLQSSEDLFNSLLQKAFKGELTKGN